MKRILDEARRMIRIKSVTDHGNEELANYVATLMQSRGLKAQLQLVTHSFEDVSKRQFNVVGILGDPLVDRKTRKGLLLNAHLDTVGPGLSENWTETESDPYAATVKDGKIFGLGAADAKIDFLCKLFAIEKFRERKLKMPVYLVGTCGEELGMFGAKYLIKSLSLNPKYVLVGEPTEMKVTFAHKCYQILKVSIGHQMVERDARGFNRRIDLHSFGVSAHGAYPDTGSNAIHQMMDFLRHAGEAGFEIRFTRLWGGESVNKVPDRAGTEFYLTSHQFEDFKRFFRENVRVRNKEKAFRVELGGLGDTGVRFLPDSVFTCVSDVVSFFRAFADEIQTKKDESYVPPFSTINFGMLKQTLGGMELYFDFRILPDMSPEEIEAQITRGVEAIGAHYPNLNITVSRERMNPSLNMTPGHEFVKICQEALDAAGGDKTLAKTATSTEASQFFQAGYEAVVFGPGSSRGSSHGPNEHSLLDHIETTVSFYQKVIERVCT